MVRTNDQMAFYEQFLDSKAKSRGIVVNILKALCELLSY